MHRVRVVYVGAGRGAGAGFVLLLCSSVPGCRCGPGYYRCPGRRFVYGGCGTGQCVCGEREQSLSAGTVFGLGSALAGPAQRGERSVHAGSRGASHRCVHGVHLCGRRDYQLAGILPSSVPAGDYNVTVTNAGAASPGFKATVVAHKFGIITVNGSGAGRAVVQNYISAAQYDLGRYTTGTLSGFTYSPSHPGQIIVIWGTGMGAIGSPDNVAPGAIDLRGNLDIQVIIGGTAFKPDLYAGRAPSLPGADEIVMTLPANVSTDCLVTLQVSVNGQLSNATMISIAPPAAGACSTPGLTAEQLSRFDQGGKFRVGTISLSGSVDTHTNNQQRTTVSRLDEASAIFVSLNPDDLTAGTLGQTTTPPTNGCTVTRQILSPPMLGAANVPAFSLMGAGQITLSGPNVNKVPISTITLLNGNVAGVTATSGAVLTGGAYSVAGLGGKDVGPFQATIQMEPPLVVTGGVPRKSTAAGHSSLPGRAAARAR